jgi:ketosteroid isomerase-like protein
MLLSDSLRKFIELCERAETVEAIARFYAEDVVVFENHERSRAGREACLAHEREALARTGDSATFKVLACAENSANNTTFIEWQIRFIGKGGRPMRLDEVAVQRWHAGRIVEERFYYEGMIDEGDEE